MVRLLILLLILIIKVRKEMIKYWTFGFLLLVLTGSAQVKVENDSIIIWNKDRKIIWDDFLSENKDNLHKYKNEEHADAGIAVSIQIYPKEINCWDIDYLEVVAQMNKTKSWTKSKMDVVLNHEQVHFDIVELYARKIRKSIPKFIEESEECDLQGIADIYYRLIEEHWQTQFLYDEETRHSINFEKQQEWDKKIADSLEAYKDYELIIDIDELDLD